MTNIDNNILQELEKANNFNEMNIILTESDCVLVNAETQLNAIKNDSVLKKIEKDIENNSESGESSALSIEVSRDLFKEFDSENDISAIYPTSVDPTSTKITDEEEKENDEMMGPSLEITITNDVGADNENVDLETTLLNDSKTFKGCSPDFVTNKETITVVVDVEKGRSVMESQKYDINSNKKITLKRPHNDNQATVVKKQKIEIFDNTQTEYTQVLFDPDETADANDPRWSQYNNNLSIDGHFESVRKQWRSMALPNPHKNLTMRFLPENKHNSEITPNNENGSMSCVNYLDNKINRYTQKVDSLYVKLRYLPQSNKGRQQRNKLLREIEELQKFVVEIVKNREEIQQNFMFYKHPNNNWNANYLTRTELDEIKEQERLLEFQKRFYK